MDDRWSRLERLIGSFELSKLKTKKVLVVGLGGVGGYVVEGLVRSGVVDLTIVDGDYIEQSNLNRQIIALEENIGLEKANLMKERIFSIYSNAIVDSKVMFVDEDNLEQIFTKKYDYVIDACDTVKTKKLLIEKCLREDIPIISCMGTARKMDPRKLEIMDIEKTSYDPLARVIRHFMKKSFPNKKLMVLSSKEVPKKMTDDDSLASCIFVPAVAGLLIAHFVIEEFIK